MCFSGLKTTKRKKELKKLSHKDAQKKKKKKKNSKQSFQEDPDLTFAQETLCLMNDLIQQFLERLIVEVNIMVKEELEKKEQEFLERLKSDYGVCHAVRRVITGVFSFLFFFCFYFFVFIFFFFFF